MANDALRYIFWLSLLLIAVAYYAGTVKVFNAIGANVGGLILKSTGRNDQGQFASYPSGG